jgi:hypothetical protein
LLKILGIISLLAILFIIFIAVSAGDYLTGILAIPALQILILLLAEDRSLKSKEKLSSYISLLPIIFVGYVAFSAGIYIVVVLVLPLVYILIRLTSKQKK